MDPQTKEKVRAYVREVIGEGKDWEAVAEGICYSLDKGIILNVRSITYDPKGERVIGIKGMEVIDGVLQFKEKKKPLKAVVEEDDTPNPLIETLRTAQSIRRRPVVL